MRALLAQASMFCGDFWKQEENWKQINVIRSWSHHHYHHHQRFSPAV